MNMGRFSRTVALIAVLASPLLVVAAGPVETNETQRSNLSVAKTWGRDGRGLRIDLALRQVEVLAEACPLGAGGTVEFPIVGEESDRDYESLFRTFAHPGEIAVAIESLGLPRGRNASAYTMNYWPRGERVAIDVRAVASTNGVWVPLSKYIVDLATRAPIAFESFVYCGSVDDADSTSGERICDTYAPNAVLSTYNDGQTVLDMPARLQQSDVYGRFVLSPDAPFEPFALYELRFRPAPRSDGKPRVRNVSVSAFANDGQLAYELQEAGETLAVGGIEAVREAVEKMAADGFDLFAYIHYALPLTVSEAANATRSIAMLEGDNGLKVGGPAEDGVYYKAFIPDETWRERKGRPSQPWEMRLAVKDGGVVATLVKTIEDWSASDSLEPILSTKEFAAETPDKAVEIVKREGDSLPVMLVFAPASMRLESVMPYLLAIKATHPVLWVFEEN